jgi:2-phosphosulfolactate phosphatase
MNINISEFIEGAEEAKGLTVIIDVFRAFSVACYLFDKGAKSVLPVETVSQAFHIKEKNPDFLLLGERNARKVNGFDFGNSPTEILKHNIENKTIIQTTSAGTRGLTHAIYADEIITGSFVNVKSIIKFIQQKNPETVSLVAMGYNGESRTDEDILCAEYIKNSLSGISSDFESMKKKIKNGTGARFFQPENAGHSPFGDFELCLDLNRFPFVLRVKKERNQLFLQKILI